MLSCASSVKEDITEYGSTWPNMAKYGRKWLFMCVQQFRDGVTGVESDQFSLVC